MAKTISKIFLFLFILFGSGFSQAKYLPLREGKLLGLQPNGNYAVMFFDEDAQGTYCAVIYYKPMGSSIETNIAWDIRERVWQNQIWSSGITDIAWSPNGKYLYITTESIYGDGGCFCLDLNNKTYKRILPEIDVKFNNTPFETRIERIDEKTGTLFVTVVSLDDKKSYYKTTEILMDNAP